MRLIIEVPLPLALSSALMSWGGRGAGDGGVGGVLTAGARQRARRLPDTLRCKMSSPLTRLTFQISTCWSASDF